MTDQIKNRVVGAIVLFALAIIFIPKIFDGEKESQRREFIAIPKKPIHQVPRHNDTVNESVINDASMTESTPNELSDNQINDRPEAAPTIVKEQSVGLKTQAWVIKMGTFGNPDNVKAFVKKLRVKGFTAFSVPTVPKVGVNNKVFIGPELNQDVLVKLQPKLKVAFKESGVIEKYNPLL